MKKDEELRFFGEPQNPYEIIKRLGSGASATVYKCKRGFEEEEELPSGALLLPSGLPRQKKDPKPKHYAVKVIEISKLRMLEDFEAETMKLDREVTILQRLRHPTIVR